MLKKLGFLMSLLLAALVACGGNEAEETALPPVAAEGISVGAAAPAFTLPASDGKTVSLADYAGKPVLLYFHMALG